jgi:hypothetical protein
MSKHIFSVGLSALALLGAGDAVAQANSLPACSGPGPYNSQPCVPTPPYDSCTQSYATSGIAGSSGYGSAWDVVFGGLDVSVDCDGNIVTVGAGNANQYVYKTAYVYQGSWQPLSLTSTSPLQANNWYTSSATANLGSVDLTQTTYVVGYVCDWTGSVWKCGCADEVCAAPAWQLQAVKGIRSTNQQVSNTCPDSQSGYPASKWASIYFRGEDRGLSRITVTTDSQLAGLQNITVTQAVLDRLIYVGGSSPEIALYRYVDPSSSSDAPWSCVVIVGNQGGTTRPGSLAETNSAGIPVRVGMILDFSNSGTANVMVISSGNPNVVAKVDVTHAKAISAGTAELLVAYNLLCTASDGSCPAPNQNFRFTILVTQ